MAEVVVVSAPAVQVVTVASTGTTVTLTAPTATTVTLSSNTGPQGPIGPAGINGPASFVFAQGVDAAVWTVTHNLGWRPNVTVIDSSGRTVEGDIAYTSANVLTLTFSSAFAGTAYLS